MPRTVSTAALPYRYGTALGRGSFRSPLELSPLLDSAADSDLAVPPLTAAAYDDSASGKSLIVSTMNSLASLQKHHFNIHVRCNNK